MCHTPGFMYSDTNARLSKKNATPPYPGLVGAENLLKALFPDEKDRPTIRWLRRQQKNRTIPYIKIGKFVWFDVEQVRAHLERRQTIQARS